MQSRKIAIGGNSIRRAIGQGRGGDAAVEDADRIAGSLHLMQQPGERPPRLDPRRVENHDRGGSAGGVGRSAQGRVQRNQQLTRRNSFRVQADGFFQTMGGLDELIVPLAKDSDAIQSERIADELAGRIGIGSDNFGPRLAGGQHDECEAGEHRQISLN